MIRIMFKALNWAAIWYWFKLPLLVLVLIIAGWLIYGCAQFPYTPVETPSESQILIDLEVERVSAWNEALRKLKAVGCSKKDGTLILTDEYIDSEGNKYFEYECMDNNKVWHKLRKFQDRWVIHGE